MRRLMHKALPKFSTLLCGRQPRDDYGFQSGNLQTWHNDTEKRWQDPAPHYHTDSDEIFIVLQGCIMIQVEGQTHTINAGEYYCFGVGVVHSLIAGEPPVQSLMIRAPSIEDKIYPNDD